MITLKAIRTASSPESYTRGNTVHKRGYVKEMQIQVRQPAHIIMNAKVRDDYEEYESKIVYNCETDEIVDFGCTCSEYGYEDKMCKHCVGLALEYWDYAKNNSDDILDENSQITQYEAVTTAAGIQKLIYKRSMREKAKYFQPDLTGRIELVPVFTVHAFDKWSVRFKIGAEVKYVMKDITEFIRNYHNGETVSYGHKLSFIHERSAFTKRSQSIVDFIEEKVMLAGKANNVRYGGVTYSYGTSIRKDMPLDSEELVRLMFIMRGEDVEIGKFVVAHVMDENPIINMTLKYKDEGYILTIPAVETYFAKNAMCIIRDNKVYCCSQNYFNDMQDVLALANSISETRYTISYNDMNAFCQMVLPQLQRYTELTKPDEVEVFEPEPCKLSIYLDEENKLVTCTIYAEYGDEKYNVLKPVAVGDMYRDIAVESKAMSVALGYFDKDPKTMNYLRIKENDEDRIYQLISTGIMQLRQCGDLYVSDAIKRLQIIGSPHVKVGVSVHAGLLDVEINADGLSPAEIEGILGNYRARKKYFRLESGEFLQLEDSGLTAIAELADGLDLKSDSMKDGHIEVPAFRAYYLDQILRENGQDLEIKRQHEFKSVIRNMKQIEDSDFDVPTGLNASLRPYQKFGYRWLRTLCRLGFGGILADDMGLGKTVQMIAFILAMKENATENQILDTKKEVPKSEENKEQLPKTLIVCPASLVYNWENEINKFAPSLKVATIAGQASERKKMIETGQVDIYLTSYDLLKRDIELYNGIHFEYMVIDEAQNIKNYVTQAARAVKTVSSGTRFALTGTPIENTLSELWSIFDFLMPGILKNYTRFKEDYEQPIVNGDDTVAARLQKMIKPFVLRRLKKDVLKELPDKIEEVIYSKMEVEQRRIYEANAKRVQMSIAQKTGDEIRSGKLQILAELTRLRQICCDPTLVYEDYAGGSAKLDTCMEIIDNAVQGGNKILLFSQFTTMLEIIMEELRKKKIPFYSLTGATPKEKRNELVKSFNENDIPVFLISLKAGGTGLNLTSASIVIHYDPWWNIAAQNQATDRAHRIGQKQVVTVYKLITKNTLEEKILKLQEQKAMLSDEIISEGSLTENLATRDDFMELLNISEME